MRELEHLLPGGRRGHDEVAGEQVEGVAREDFHQFFKPVDEAEYGELDEGDAFVPPAAMEVPGQDVQVQQVGENCEDEAGGVLVQEGKQGFQGIAGGGLGHAHAEQKDELDELKKQIDADEGGKALPVVAQGVCHARQSTMHTVISSRK